MKTENVSELAKVFSELQAKALSSQLMAIEEMINSRLSKMEENQKETLARIESRLDRFGLPQPIVIDNRDKVTPYPM